MTKLLLIAIALLLVACNNKDDAARAAALGARTEAKQKFEAEILNKKPDWAVKASIPPGDIDHVIKMVYQDEIGLGQTAIFCMAVFENLKTKEYKLVAPWIDKEIRIQKSNVLGDEPQVVPRSLLEQNLKKEAENAE